MTDSGFPEIEIDMQFTITVLEKSPDAEAFRVWYKTVFSSQHPRSAGDFDFSDTEFQNVKGIEIQAMNPSFTFEALLSLYEDYSMFQFELSKQNVKVTKVKKGSGAVNLQ